MNTSSRISAKRRFNYALKRAYTNRIRLIYYDGKLLTEKYIYLFGTFSCQANIKITLWDVTPCNLVDSYQRFREIIAYILSVENTATRENRILRMLVSIYHSTKNHIPEDSVPFTYLFIYLFIYHHEIY
jgi:hypothetical protein